MRRVICALLAMAAWTMTASPALASTIDSGPQAEFGTVRSNAGTLYAVWNNGSGPSVSTIGTAGWNSCTSGYSPVGDDFDQNGFWLCARNDLTSATFYAGNVVNNTGYFWTVHGGSVTSDGDAGWNNCPSSATLLGTEFSSDGFWLCYDPPPPPPASTTPSGTGTTTVVPPPSPAPAPVSTPTPTRQVPRLHAELILRWAWTGDQTWLTGMRVARLPRNATVVVSCRGRGCPRSSMTAGSRRLRGLRSRLLRRRYRSGDRIRIMVTAPGSKPEIALIVIRRGRRPRAGLLTG